MTSSLELPTERFSDGEIPRWHQSEVGHGLLSPNPHAISASPPHRPECLHRARQMGATSCRGTRRRSPSPTRVAAAADPYSFVPAIALDSQQQLQAQSHAPPPLHSAHHRRRTGSKCWRWRARLAHSTRPSPSSRQQAERARYRKPTKDPARLGIRAGAWLDVSPCSTACHPSTNTRGRVGRPCGSRRVL
eukprot:scaffold3013_cov113-Isochrysis_galbana.AAC.4